MQASPSTERRASAAVRNGLLFGAITAVVYIVSAFIQDITGTTVALITIGSAFTPLALLNLASLIVALVLFFLAGLRTARTDARLSSAAAAGFIAALMVSIVEITTLIVNQGFLYGTTINTLRADKRLADGGFHYLMFLNAVAGSMLTLIIYIALGAGFGFVAGILQGQFRQEALWR
ncbi:MAG: hypothetical protein ACLQUY_06360 [Ktedonobacterales bacterium]